MNILIIVIEKTMQPLHVKHLTRVKHVFETHTTYSWDIHYFGGMVYYGLVPPPPLNLLMFE
jgi:hypothetical protein